MSCYKDRTYCEYQECKHFDECPRKVTEEDKAMADKLGLPMSVFMGKPECYAEEPDGD